jgi:hypothetical protein
MQDTSFVQMEKSIFVEYSTSSKIGLNGYIFEYTMYTIQYFVLALIIITILTNIYTYLI